MPALWTAFAARNGTGDLLVASSPDGVNCHRPSMVASRSTTCPTRRVSLKLVSLVTSQ